MKLVGRAEELAFLHAAWSEVVGRSCLRIIGVEGPPGIGKSALIEHFLRDLGGDAGGGAVRVCGTPSGVVHAWQLFTAIRRALALDPSDDDLHVEDLADVYLMGRRLRELLATVRIVTIDDAHWVDQRSAAALRHAAADLAGQPMLLLLAYPVGEPHRRTAGRRVATPDPLQPWTDLFGTSVVHRVRLKGLSTTELAELVVGRGYPLPPAAAAPLHRRTDGNPLHTIRLLEVVTPPDILRGTHSLRTAPDEVVLFTQGRLSTCSATAREFLFAGAVLGRAFSLSSVQEVTRSTELTTTVAEALRTGLVAEGREGSRTLEFVSDDHWDATWQEIPWEVRHALHVAAAGLNSDEAVWHKVQAGPGQDEALAAEVEAFADDEYRTGRALRAAEYRRYALDLTSRGSPHRIPRLLRAVESMLVNRDRDGAEQHANEIAACPPEPWRDYVLGYLELLRAQVDTARRLLTGALAALEGGESGRAGAPNDLLARIAGQLAVLAVLEVDYPGMRRYGEKVIRRLTSSTDVDPAVLSFGWFARSVGAVLAGEDHLTAEEELTRSNAFRTRSRLDALVARGMIRLWTDRLEPAHHDLGAAVERALKGETLRITQALAYLSEVEFRRGDLTSAKRTARWAIRDAEANANDWDVALVHALATYALAAGGHLDEAEESAGTAEVWAWSAATRAYAAGACAAVAQARGDAGTLLDAARRIDAEYDSREPGTHLFAGIAAEALCRLGRMDEAWAALTQYEKLFAGTRRTSTQVALHRVRAGLLLASGSHQGSLDEAGAAVARAEQIGLRLEAERARLVMVECLVANRLPARAQMECVHGIRNLTDLGAGAYRDQLMETCLRLGLDTLDPWAGLTPGQAQIVAAVAAGATRSSLASSLKVSESALEQRLTPLYRQTNLRRFEELRRHVEKLGPPPS